MEAKHSDITGVVLAGGKSKRFGSNKAYASFQGLPFLERIYQVMTSVFSEVLLITNDPQDYQSVAATVLQDEVPDQGPLSGIATAFKYSDHEYAFVVACDMPLIKPKLIHNLIKLGRGHDATIPIKNGRQEYLMALYKRSLQNDIQTSLNKGVRSMKDFIRSVNDVHWVPIDGNSTSNINTPEDLKNLEKTHA